MDIEGFINIINKYCQAIGSIKLFNAVIQMSTLCNELGCPLIVNFEIIRIVYYIHSVLFF